MPAAKHSSITMALAGKSGSVDIPKPRDADSSFAAQSVRTAPGPAMLPTPPNSISPSLPPRDMKRRGKAQNTCHVESDIDLQDAVEHAKCLDQPAVGRGSDAAGAITPSLLAKHHLPEILLNNGPLAIRHVMGYLATSVPGFAAIPPAKARRLVVAALEGRGCGGEGGGVTGDVIFEKVGWGRWDARLKGHQKRRQRDSATPPGSVPVSYNRSGAHVANGAQGHQFRRSIADDSMAFSRSSDLDFLPEEHDYGDADQMSLDDSCNDSCSSSEAPDDVQMDDDVGDVTDEEDWASIGAAALRAGSFPTAGNAQNYNFLANNYGRHFIRGGGPSTLPRSLPSTSTTRNFDLPDGVGSDSQEREAIEALLRMGSM